MHVLDISSNSVRANSDNIYIKVEENVKGNEFIFYIEDDGAGIPEDMLKDIKNPFTTTRTLRKVGLGIPLLNDNCLLSGGSLEMTSKVGVGTKLIAKMGYDNIDRPPLGDMASTICGLITSNENINVKYEHIYNDNKFEISTNEIKEILGDVPLNEIEIVRWLREYIGENIDEIKS